MTKMNPEVKRVWVDALRSGQHEQGEGALRRAESGKVCCLGVLCIKAMEAGVPVVAKDAETGFEPDGIFTAFDDNTAVLPESVRNWAGLGFNTHGEYMTGDGCYRVLTADNDEGKTFEQIADIIEERF